MEPEEVDALVRHPGHAGIHAHSALDSSVGHPGARDMVKRGLRVAAVEFTSEFMLFHKAAKRLARSAGVESVRELSRPWEEEPFASIFASIYGTTLVGARRCYVLAALASQAAAVPGAMAEVGVYRGGTARLLAHMRPDRHFYLFDTFAGMPETDPELDLHRGGDFADTSLEAVRRFVSAQNADFRPGLFPASAVGLDAERFSLVHVDCDIYASVRDCCRWFYPRLSPGGAMVFDDYAYRSCPGVRKAVDEFFAGQPETPILAAEGQALVFRLP